MKHTKLYYCIDDSDEELDYNNYRHVISDHDYKSEHFFNNQIVDMISKKCTELLQGVDRLNRNIKISKENIINVMNSVYYNYTPENVNIHSRHVIEKQNSQSSINKIIDIVINILVTKVKTQMGIDECNSKLSKFNINIGDNNLTETRSYPKPKIREKTRNSCIDFRY